MKGPLCAGTFAIACLLTTPAKAYSPYIGYEAVDIYGPGPCNTNGSLCNPINNAQGFASWATRSFFSGPTFTWTNGNVYDSDFVDRQLNSAGGDFGNFDPEGNTLAIAFFAGHGTSDDGFGLVGSADPCNEYQQLCGTSSACLPQYNPAVTFQGVNGQYNAGAGVCRHSPGYQYSNIQYGYCAYNSDRFVIVNGNSVNFNNSVNYSFGGQVAWGESSNSGTWRGAYTDGGANVVVLSLSNGMEPGFYYQNVGNAFAGAHMIALTMPTAGDYDDPANTGAQFAEGVYFGEYDNSVALAWLEVAAIVGDGGSCGQGPNSCGWEQVTNGGYGGYNGCGCNIVMAVGATATEAGNHVDETWDDITDDSLDGQGNGWFSGEYLCNYDTNTDPIILP